MAVHTLHRSSLDKEHRASLCSGAFLFQIFLLAIVVVVPYVIAYATAGMWLFQRCYWHQPDVLFEHQAIMVAKGNTDFSQLVWSTSDPFNRMLQNQLRVPSLRSIETDQNRDGVKDKLHLELELPLRDSEDIHSVYLMLFFDFRLNELCSLSMKSLGMIDYTASVGMSELYVEGDLVFKQREPLPWRGNRNKYNIPVTDMTSQNAISYDFETILSNYFSRNDTTDFVARATYAKGDRASGQPFKLKLTIHYPPQQVCYRPGFWQEVKVGWIQYAAFLIPLVYLAIKLENFVFNHQIVYTVTRMPRLKPD
eukprot:m.15545 g.15545  ORF g.15545 m.15545 type:complete len:309 (+) comp5425_c0_seq2:225-1151(+)